MSTLTGFAQLAYLPAASQERAKWVCYNKPNPPLIILQIIEQVAQINKELYEQELGTTSFLWTLPIEGDRKEILVFEMYVTV